MNEQHDFLMEKRLLELDPILHKRFTASVFGLQHILSNYKLLFPLFTDHTELHSLNVIDFSNHLIGTQIERMNADEIYVLLMGAYLHDTGMGITEKDYEEFISDILTLFSEPDADKVFIDAKIGEESEYIYANSPLLIRKIEEYSVDEIIG